MYLIVIGLGLWLQIYGPSGILSESRATLARYPEPFESWQWFYRAPWPLQLSLYFLPLVLVYSCFGWIFSVNSSFIGVFLYLLAFLVSVTGYARLLTLNDLNQLLALEEWQDAKQLMEAECALEPARYHQLFMAQAMLRLLRLIACELFVALFWFLVLGPFAAIVVLLLMQISLSRELPDSLQAKAGIALRYLAWIPLRLFALSLAWVLRSRRRTADAPDSLAPLWTRIKDWHQSVDACLEITLRYIGFLGGVELNMPEGVGLESDYTVGPHATARLTAAEFKKLGVGIKKTLFIWFLIIGVMSLLL